MLVIVEEIVWGILDEMKSDILSFLLSNGIRKLKIMNAIQKIVDQYGAYIITQTIDDYSP